MPNTSKSFDVVVVGGGIVALSIAWEVSQRLAGHRIAVVSQDDIGQASRAAGAMLSGFSETTEFAMRSEPGRVKAAWRIDAARRWKTWAAQLSDASGVRISLLSGTVIVDNAVSGPLDQRNFEAILQSLRQANEPFSFVDAVRDVGLYPTAQDRPMRSVYLPGEHWISSRSVLRALRHAVIERSRLEHIRARCTSIISAPGETGYRVETPAGHLHSPIVIVAAGVGSLDLLRSHVDLLARFPPLVAGVGSALVCRSHDRATSIRHAVRTPNRAFACGLHVLPFGKSRVYVGATNNVRPRPSSRALLGDIEFLINCAAHQVDQALTSFTLQEVRTGSRPVSLDTYPLIGETHLRGLWLATGTYRDGFLLAPLVAERIVTAILENKSLVAEGQLFAPERDPLNSSTLEEAVHEGVDNYVAIACERGLRLPALTAWQDDLVAGFERRVRALYQQFDLSYVPPPDFLWDMENGDLLPLIREYSLRRSHHT